MKDSFQETTEKKQRELLKEVLRRANTKEKEQHQQISDRKTAIIKRIVATLEEYEELSDEKDKNKCPESTAAQDKRSLVDMSMEEFNEWIARYQKESDEHFEWSTKVFDIMKKQMVLIKEFLELTVDLWSLENKENGCWFQ